MLNPDVYEVDVRDGEATPLPDYVAIIADARYFGVTPMDIEQWPLEWIVAGRIMREAESLAERKRRASS